MSGRVDELSNGVLDVEIRNGGWVGILKGAESFESSGEGRCGAGSLYKQMRITSWRRNDG